MANTCAGYDNTAPSDVLVAIRDYVKKQKGLMPTIEPYVNRTHLDDEDCCMLRDLDGSGCTKDSSECRYRPAGKITDHNKKIPL